ncbi:hypothetical protein EBU95_20680 [bacterium]|nr:hypothetical protein [bacterium]
MATQNEVKTALTAATADALINETVGKKFYESKTFWTNIIAATALIAQIKFGFIFDAEVQALMLTGINLVLRKITKDPVTW